VAVMRGFRLRKVRVCRDCVLLAAYSVVAPASYAQDFPDRPVRAVIPYGVGGSADVLARLVAPGISANLGQSLVIDNRGGGAGLPAITLVAKAIPNGYTVLLVASNFASNPILFKKLPYDAEKDFAPVSLIAIVPAVLVTHPGAAINSAQDLIALAKAKPGTLNYGSVGNGSGNHLVTEVFANAAGLQLVHVPYKSAGAFMTDLASARLDFVFATIPAAHGFITSGRVKALGVSSLKRSSTLPDVPTIAESAIPGFEVNTWLGALLPAGTPPNVVKRMNAAIVNAMQVPELRERLKTVGAEPVGSSPAQLAAYLKSELNRWTTLAKTVKFEVSN
jgi:tripartite-type tricarboxylate transporter receptor subunit TctC